MPDLISRGQDLAFVFDGNTDHTLDQPDELSLPGPVATELVADLDGDGDVDLVIDDPHGVSVSRGHDKSFDARAPYALRTSIRRSGSRSAISTATASPTSRSPSKATAAGDRHPLRRVPLAAQFVFATSPTTQVMLSSPPRWLASSMSVCGSLRYHVIATMRSSSPCST